MEQGLVPTGSKYTDEDRRQAVVLYLTLGTNIAVAKEIGCDDSTISRWRESEWWEQEAQKVAEEIEDEYRAKLRKVALKGADQAITSLDAGEVKAKDAMVISGIAYDKLRLSENRPTTISATTSGVQAKLEQLADRTLELERQRKAKLVSEQPATEAEESVELVTVVSEYLPPML